MDVNSDLNQYFVVYPQGTTVGVPGWDAGSYCCAPYSAANDVQFTSDLLDYLEANLWSVHLAHCSCCSLLCVPLYVRCSLCVFSVDTSKIFATGISQGAIMVCCSLLCVFERVFLFADIQISL